MIEDENPSFSSSTSSTRSDAQSAPPECERIFDRISEKCAECAVRADKQLPPERNMPDLVRAVIGDDEAIHMSSFLKNAYYDVIAAELMTLLESRITNFYTNFQVDEIGRVVSVGDGIARVYGLNEIQAGEMVEFAPICISFVICSLVSLILFSLAQLLIQNDWL
ncbi:hypothetical protein ACOSP7_022104 [Xanthoceras sorbifolium]